MAAPVEQRASAVLQVLADRGVGRHDLHAAAEVSKELGVAGSFPFFLVVDKHDVSADIDSIRHHLVGRNHEWQVDAGRFRQNLRDPRSRDNRAGVVTAIGRFGSDPVATTIASGVEAAQQLRCGCNPKSQRHAEFGDRRLKIGDNLADGLVLQFLERDETLHPRCARAQVRSPRWPRRAAISATFNPAGPAPTTTTWCGVADRATVRSLTSRSRPAPGFWMQRIGFSWFTW